MRARHRRGRDRIPEHSIEFREGIRRVGELLGEIRYGRRVPHLPIVALIWRKSETQGIEMWNGQTWTFVFPIETSIFT
jgi:hypothetical protein